MTMKLDLTKWGFIINPIAGNGKALEVEKALRDQLKNRDISAELVHTKKKGHASDLALELAQKGFLHIVAVGGDGTFNEVARVLVDFPNCTLGLIPAGTGNDFAQILGMHLDFKPEDWDIFFNVNVHSLDVGRCNGNLFFNGMGLGFDAQVAAENYVSPDEVKLGGKGKYVWHILKNLLFFREQKMQISSDNQQKTELCFMHTIAIGRRFAGDFFITPEAYADDGLLDVCMVKKLNLIERLKILLQVPKGTHISHPKVTYYKTDKLVIELENEVPYHLDGELFFDSHFEIDILEHKPKIIYKPNGSHFFSK